MMNTPNVSSDCFGRHFKFQIVLVLAEFHYSSDKHLGTFLQITLDILLFDVAVASY